MAAKNMHLSILASLVVSVLTLFLYAGFSKAQTGSAAYAFVLASGFLCEPGADCAAVAASPNGDTYEFSGAGTFEPPTHLIKGAGTFTHKATNGNALEAGVWTAGELLSFSSYGQAPGALLRDRSALGLTPLSPKHTNIRTFSPVPTGGLAIFRVQLLATSGVSRNAVLQVNCALGQVPADHSSEGIQLSIDRNGGEFSQPVSGRVIFLALPRTGLHSVDTPERPLPSPPESPRN